MFFVRVTELCKRKGISLSTAAREIGLSNSAITYWKRGSVPKASTVWKLADFFGVTVDYLIGKDSSHLIEHFANPGSSADEIFIPESHDIAFFKDYQELSEEDKEVIRRLTEFILERRRKENPPQN